MKHTYSTATAATLCVVVLTMLAACETREGTQEGVESAQMGSLVVDAEGEFDDSVYVEVTGPADYHFIDAPCYCCPPSTCFLRLDSLDFGQYTVEASAPDSLYSATGGAEGDLLRVYSDSTSLTAEQPTDTIMVSLGQ